MSKTIKPTESELASLGLRVKKHKNDLEAADDLLARIISGEDKKRELETNASLVMAKAEQVSGYSQEAAKRFQKELDDLRIELEKIETDLRQIPIDKETAKQRRYKISLELKASQSRLRQAEDKLRMALAEQEESEKEAAEQQAEKEEKEREDALKSKEVDLLEKFKMSQGSQARSDDDSSTTSSTET